MSLNAAYITVVANAGAAAITHIGLVNASNVEISSVSYARQAVTWAAESSGLKAPTANLVFNMTAGDVVHGWQGYSAATAGTAYGVTAFSADSTYGVGGTFTVLAASTGIQTTAV